MHFTLATRAQAKRNAPEDNDIMNKLLRADRSSSLNLKRTLTDDCQVSSKIFEVLPSPRDKH